MRTFLGFAKKVLQERFLSPLNSGREMFTRKCLLKDTIFTRNFLKTSRIFDFASVNFEPCHIISTVQYSRAQQTQNWTILYASYSLLCYALVHCTARLNMACHAVSYHNLWPKGQWPGFPWTRFCVTPLSSLYAPTQIGNEVGRTDELFSDLRRNIPPDVSSEA